MPEQSSPTLAAQGPASPIPLQRGNSSPKHTEGLEMPNPEQISSPLTVLPQGET